MTTCGGASVDVVSAIIIRKNRILLTQRRPEKDFPFTWECPGGKVEYGESHTEALARELREEIAVDLKSMALTPVWTGIFKNAVQRKDRASINLFMYRTVIFGEPVAQECQGLGWFTIHELGRFSLAPGNRLAILQIARCLEEV